MKIILEADGSDTLIVWRSVRGHREDDGTWVTDDPGGQRTGPHGKHHVLRQHGGSTATLCGKEPPDGSERPQVAALQEMCLNCLRILMRPHLP